MGMPMVRRIHAAGVQLMVFARRAEVIDELRALGISHTQDVQELTASSNIVEICLLSDPQVDELLYGAGLAAALRPGTVFLSHVTGNPDVYKTLAQRVAPGVGVLDAPVSGTAIQIANGDLTVLLGGPDKDVQRVTPVLETFSSHVIHCGPLGDGQRVKLVNNLLFTLNVRFAGEAIRIGEGLGIEQSRLVRAISQCSGRTWALGLLEHVPFTQFAEGTRRYLDKDVDVVFEVAKGLGVDLGIAGSLAKGSLSGQ